MLLKVGELAKRTGITVRTLHHYDSIGLLRPSARSDSGYRLYNQADVARLHGIQVLRRIGLPLEEIGAMLGEESPSLPQIVARQLRALEREIEQATALRDRLALAQAKFSAGSEPELNDWLETLQLMSTCDKYFSAAEIKLIFGNWARIEGQWNQVVDAVQALMDTGISPLDARVQPLAQRWMNLMHTWMKGDFDLMLRWGEMYHAEPSAHSSARPGLAMIRFIEQAVQLRLALLKRYLTDDDLKRLAPVPDTEWSALADSVLALIPQQLPPHAPPVLAVLKRWNELVEHVTRRDPALRERLQRAYQSEPLLRDAAPLNPVAREYLMKAATALAAAGPTPTQIQQDTPAGA
ncbi:MerR family transcriptional regulator [Aquabacterium sp.]|uniref:MerR family transcriptional regulator n=1 Tax=Aquabacterium sp. TaxID=1872578 RepID=UPI002BADD6DF|nr:MerR family transcriptional regulator [Aquabacterium sp.]HSW07716.1 MerR family transcriptional regulator [Aquabacterium sp.]